MTRLITTATVHFNSGETSVIALLENHKEFIIASGFQGKDEDENYWWTGNGDYSLTKLDKTNTPTNVLKAFIKRLEHEEQSIFVDKITF